mgnify:CR=1 FL=1
MCGLSATEAPNPWVARHGARCRGFRTKSVRPYDFCHYWDAEEAPGAALTLVDELTSIDAQVYGTGLAILLSELAALSRKLNVQLICEGRLDKLRAGVLGPCCHHRCEWGAYPARGFLAEALGVTEAESAAAAP